MKNTHILDKYHYQFLVAIFIIMLGIGYAAIEYSAKNRINHHLVDQLEASNIQYKMIYNTYKKISLMAFLQIVKTTEVTDIFYNIDQNNTDLQRQKLYTLMKPKYKILKKLGIEQLHFHLRDNRSFLRMHKVEKYGDDLSDIRYSVTYVNEKHKRISGFEQGRVIHGYRFVYPLKNKNGIHLGSVEVSINTDSFVKIFENTIFKDAYLIIDKKTSQTKLFKGMINEYYAKSLEGDNYLITKETDKEPQDELSQYLHKNIKKYQSKIQQKLSKKIAFSQEIKTGSEYYIKSYIPIRNIKEKTVVAYFITSQKSQDLADIYYDLFYIKIAWILFVSLIVYIIHRNLLYSSTLRQTIKQKTDELEASQHKIIEAEKMSSLGTLVAGVAHEVNTPVGLSITAMSHFLDETKNLKLKYDKEDMTQENFENYLKNSVSTADIVFVNLVRAAELIKSFKQISVDQSTESIREINVKHYIDEILLSLHNKTKKKHIAIQTDIDENLHLKTYPGAWSQIFTNLILNSEIHAFETTDNPTITITIKKEDSIIVIDYRDNGCGLDLNHVGHIFDPFFTTKRGSGGSGLGMHIVYNLVTQKLGGNIEVDSQEDDGIHFLITLEDKE